ncbi:MAG: dephospho-CoA kinase [Aggregatilineales bacterium]
MREGKYVIGLTGNIAVGKSVVRQMLQHLGAYTIDADGLTHQAMAPGAPAYQPIIEMFGRFIVQEDGTINRAILGNIVFSYPEALTKLEQIVHPIVNQAIVTLVSRAKQRVVVIEAIKLLESNLLDLVDSVWVVDASPETQLKRLTEKRKMSEDEARKRIIAQRPQADKIARADVIIINEGNVEDTWKQVQSAWADVRRLLVGTGMGQSSVVPTASATAGASGRPATASLSPTSPGIAISIRRGMPANAEAIARFITRLTNRPTERMDIMLAFGQKSYLLALDHKENLIGLSGWQVENLITRVDEFLIEPTLPSEPIVRALTAAIEDASRELQSEVSFVFLPENVPPETMQVFMSVGYQPLKLEEIKFPAWREAAHELLHDGTVALMKQLRADRVMKPI